MGTLTVSRKQRLRTLETEIRKASDNIQSNGLLIGRYLCEIRDEELWQEDYDSWSQYLKDRAEELVGKSFAHSSNLIRAAEVQKRLPSNNDIVDKNVLTPSHFSELARLAPLANREDRKDPQASNARDYSQLRKQDIARVLQKATERAGGESPTVIHVRMAVDEDLGIDRAAKAKAAKAIDRRPDLRIWMDRQTGTIEGILESLKEAPKSALTLLSEDEPGLVKRFTAACRSLAAFCGRMDA